MSFRQICVALTFLASANSSMAFGQCHGVPQSCEWIPVSACTFQVGCNINPTTHECSGMPYSCELISSQFSCTNQRGCYWQNVPFAEEMDPVGQQE